MSSQPLPDPKDQPTAILRDDLVLEPVSRSSSIPAALLAWDRYEVFEVLGQGGMAKVYRARDRKLNRMVALKFIREEHQGGARILTLEAQLQASLDHENIVKVYETGTFDGLPFIAMQLVQGETLDRVCTDDLRARVGLLVQVALALDSAHRQGMVHRDLKPSNIMVEAVDGRLKPYLMDFGLARLTNVAGQTKATSIVGTLAYMSPEQAEGNRPLDIRTDVHGLGTLLYEFLCGHPPFMQESSSSHVEIIRRLLDEEATPPSRHHPEVPRDLEIIALKCLEKQPERRYATAAAMAEDLQCWLEGRPIKARRTSLLEQALKGLLRLRKNRQAWLTTQTAGLAILFLLGLGAWTLWRARQRADFVAQMGMTLIRLEEIVQASEMGPLHDTRSDRRQVNELLNHVRSDAARYGSSMRAPLAYALGRFHLALHDYEAALEDLQAAWDLGFRNPESAEGLGTALGEVYRLRRQNLEQLKDPERRKLQEGQLKKTLQEPALAHLSEAQGGRPEDQDYRSALADAFAGRHEAVLARTNRLLKEAPLGYRYLKLRASAEMGLATLAIDKGDHPAALLRVNQACQSLQQALEIARSDKESWLNLGRAADHLIYLSRFLGGNARESWTLGMGACAKARSLDPADPLPLLQEAELIRSLARAEEAKGIDPSASFGEAIARLDQALLLSPDNLEARRKLGLLYWSLANVAVDHQKPCLELLEKAEGHLRRVLTQRPGDVFAVAILLDVIFDQCQDRDRRGEDVLPSLDQAILVFEKSRELEPTNGRIYNVGVILHIQRGAIRGARGQDPLPDLDRGLSLVDEVIGRNPAYVSAISNRSLLLRLRAEQKWRTGTPYEADLEEALATAQRGMKVRATNDTLLNLGAAHTLRGTLRARVGGDPRKDLAEALEQFTRAEQQDPQNPSIFYNKVEARLMEAEWLLRQGRSAAEVLRACRRDLDHVRPMAPESPDLLTSQAKAFEMEALEAARAGGSPAPLLKRALTTLEPFDKQPVSVPERRALRARILRRLADCERGPGAEKLREQARVLLVRALAENPFLTSEYGGGAGLRPGG